MFDMKYDPDKGTVLKSSFKEESIQQEIDANESESATEDPVTIEQIAQSVQEDEQKDIAEEIAQPIKESNSERNHRALRELKDKAEQERKEAQRERDEALRRMRDLEDRYERKSHAPQSEDDDLVIGEDDLAEGKHLKKVAQRIKYLEKKVEQYESQSRNNSIQSQIRAEFPDFTKVVTPENIALLKHLKPHQAAVLETSGDLYATAAAAYEMIKEYGIYQTETPMIAQQKAIAQKNMTKPRPSASIAPQQGDSPLSRANAFANGLTPDLARAMRVEMEEARSRL